MGDTNSIPAGLPVLPDRFFCNALLFWEEVFRLPRQH